MKYRRLGSSPLQLSEIGFGLWTVSTNWWGQGLLKEETAIRLLHKAFDLGINFFDTADTYGNGYGETILAKTLGDRRDKIVISTKGGYDFYHGAEARRGQQELPQCWDPEYLRKAIEESLKRLKTDYLDLYQLHNPRLDAIRRDDTFAELEALKQQGKLRAYGVALGPAIAERQIEEANVAMQLRRVDVVQIIYNLLEQMLGQGTFAVARETKAGFLIRVPHASGLLEGDLTPQTTFPQTDHRWHRVNTPERRKAWLIEGLKKVDQLKFLTQRTGRTLRQAAIQFILSEPSVASCLPNIYDEAQLTELVGASETEPLTREELKKIQELYDHNFYLETQSVSKDR